VRQLPKLAEAYKNYSELKLPDGSASEYLKAFKEFNSIQHFPILLAAREMGPSELNFLLRIVEERVLLSLFAKEGPQNFEKIVPEWAGKIRRLVDGNPRPTQTEILEACSPAFLDLRALWNSYKTQFADLSYVGDRRKVKFALARIAAMLEADCANEVSYESLLVSNIAIDHIEPQTSNRFARKEFLKERYGQSAPPGLGEIKEETEERLQIRARQWIHSIGNLSLIAKRANSSMSNFSPVERSEHYNQSQLAINMMLCREEDFEEARQNRRRKLLELRSLNNLSLADWGPDVIDRRTGFLMRTFARTLSLMAPSEHLQIDG